MSNAKHTPGPWHVCEGNTHLISDSHHMTVAEARQIGWSADIWQSAKLSDPEWGSATDFGIESHDLGDGTQTDFIHLLDND